MTGADRYSRQIRLAEIGPERQAQLQRSTVLIVGIGALGSHLAEHLARAGVGHLILVDRDIVELHNLQRQVLFDEADAAAGAAKASAAATHLQTVNSEVTCTALVEDFGPDTFAALPARPDLVLDGTDNFATRYLINDLCAKEGLTWIYAGVVGCHGTAMVVPAGRGPCLRCMMPEPPATGESQTCETTGVLGPAVGMVTAFVATEALKILSGRGDAVSRGIFTFDLWHFDADLKLREAGSAPHCKTCTGESFPALEMDWQQSVSLCGRNAVQVLPRGSKQVSLDGLAVNLLGAVAGLEQLEQMLRFEVEDVRFTVFPGGRALLFGIDDTDRARSLYDRYIGA